MIQIGEKISEIERDRKKPIEECIVDTKVSLIRDAVDEDLYKFNR